MNLPQEFVSYTSDLFGPERWQRFLHALGDGGVTSIRLNPFKRSAGPVFPHMTPVPWCDGIKFLKQKYPHKVIIASIMAPVKKETWQDLVKAINNTPADAAYQKQRRSQRY